LKEETLLTLAKARAIENTLYVVIAAQYSQHFSGRSSVVDPLGVVVIDLGIGEKYREVTIDLDVIDEVRKLIPTLKLRRPELYRTS
jgi:predicted amidohydrolase